MISNQSGAIRIMAFLDIVLSIFDKINWTNWKNRRAIFWDINLSINIFFFRANTRRTKFYKFSNFLRTLEIVTIKIERNTISVEKKRAKINKSFFQMGQLQLARSISCIIINGNLRSKHNSAKWAADVGRIDYSGEKPIHRSVSNGLSNLVPFLDRENNVIVRNFK